MFAVQGSRESTGQQRRERGKLRESVVSRKLVGIIAMAVVCALAAFALMAVWGARDANAATLQSIGSFNKPLDLRSDPTDPDRLYIGEKDGRVMMRYEGVTTTVLNITSLAGTGPEDGLISFELAPDFSNSGKLYVMYTTPNPGGQNFQNNWRIEEFTMSTTTYTAPLSSRRPLIEIFHPTDIHNGGQVHFGPDGYLYASIGDGGHLNDPDGQGQNPNTLLATMMRIDPKPNGENPYTIPVTNPIYDVGSPLGRPEIWSWGLRNPWRFAFDRVTGDMVIGDVGQDTREEVNFRAAPNAGRGTNFGWSCREGTLPNPNPPNNGINCATLPWTASWVGPAFELIHDGQPGGCAIMGGFVSRDTSTPELYGRYIYGDWCASQIRSVILTESGSSGDRSEGMSVAATQLIGFAEDGCGRLYAIPNNQSGNTQISRIVGTTPNPCPPAEPPEDTTPPTISHQLTPAPPASGWYKNPPALGVTAVDNAGGEGVDQVEINLGSSWSTYSNPALIEPALPEGENTIQYRASDLAGNPSETGSVVVKVDKTAPTSSATATHLTGDDCLPWAGEGACPVRIVISSADATGMSGVDTTYARVYPAGSPPASQDDPYTGPITVDDPGDWVVRYFSIDNAGNIEQLRQLSFTVSVDRPSLALLTVKKLGVRNPVATVSCPVSASGDCTVKVPAKVKPKVRFAGTAAQKKAAKKAAKKGFKVSGPKRVAAGSTGEYELRMSKAQCKALKPKKMKISVKLQLSATAPGAAAVSRTVSLKNVVCKP